MSYISSALRQQVAERARHSCEYCLIHSDDHFLSHEVDHIIAEKHRGETVIENLCLSCFDCNRHKGSDISSVDVETGAIVALFNPRTMQWNEHFRLEDGFIIAMTPIGRVTEFLLDLNSEDRVMRRSELIEMNRYPTNE